MRARLPAPIAAIVLVACQGPTGGSPDAGAPGDAGALVDAGDLLDDAGPPALEIVGDVFTVTSDDRLAFERGGRVSVVPLAGGTPEVIAAEGAQLKVGDAASPVVRVLHVPPDIAAPGPLTLWSPTTGATRVADAAHGYAWAVDATGTWACHDERVDGGSGDLMLSRVDGTRTTLLASGVLFSGSGHCAPSARFIGATLLFRRCEPAGPTRALIALSPETGAEIVLASDVETFDVDAAGEHVVVLDEWAGTLSVVPIGGGELVLVDRDVTGFAVAGEHVVHLGAGGSLRRSAVSSPAPITLATSVARLHAVSADAARVAYATECPEGLCDVRVVEAEAPLVSFAATGAPTELIVSFTSDGRFVLFGGPGAPNPNLHDLSGRESEATAIVSITTDGVEGWLPLGASRVLYTFDGVSGPGAPSSSDLGVIDLATDRRSIVGRGARRWMLTRARDRVVYGNGTTIVVQPL